MKQRIQQLRNILRRQHLEKEFERRRKELLSNSIQVEVNTEPNAQFSKQFEQIIDVIIKTLHQQNNQIALQYSDRLVHIVQSNAYASTCFFIHSQKMSELIQLVLRNEVINQNNFKYQLLSPQMEIKMTDFILNVLHKINYNSLDQDTYFKILKSFWLIFTAKNINIESNQGLFLLQKAISIIIKMMNRSNQIVYNFLKELGIGSKMVEMIEDLRLIEKDRLCFIFSQVISLYLQHQNLFQKEKGSQVEGVQIMGIQSNQKQHLLAFCLGLLQSQDLKILQNGLTGIQMILIRFEYFAHSLRKQQVGRLCELLGRNQRTLQTHILGILESLVFQQCEPVRPYIQSQMMLDMMELQLRYQLKHKDDQTTTIIQKCLNIICNVCYKPNSKRKKGLYQHSIWQFIINSWYEKSCMLPLLTAFKYFFEYIPRDKLLPCFEFFCQNISQLQMELLQQKYKNIIQQIFVRIFYFIQDHYSDSMLDKFISIVEQNRLRDFLAEEIDTHMLQEL